MRLEKGEDSCNLTTNEADSLIVLDCNKQIKTLLALKSASL